VPTGRPLDDATIIGGGPGGLYLSILLKRDWPDTDVRVLERNRSDDTYGFGVAFHEQTLRALAEADAPSRAALDEILTPWDDVFFSVRGFEHRVSGHGFAGCSRHRLLEMLQHRAAELGVEIVFESEASADDFGGAALVVAADGANSRTRDAHADHFGPTVVARPNRFVWLGTTRPLDAMSFFFAEVPSGVFVAHAYPHTPELGTWIVEADEETFLASGLDVHDEQATATFLESVFRDQLDDHPLIVNHSHWRQFPAIRCERWVMGNLALLGDAKATVHYSIGSGTRIAMEDAVGLHRALGSAATIADALGRYERERRPVVEELQRVAWGSMRWFETYRRRWAMDPAQFILSGVTRKTNETYGSVGAKSPELVRAATSAMVGSELVAEPGDPVALPIEVGSQHLRTRLVSTGRAGANPEPDDPASEVTELTVIDLGDCRQAAAAGDAFRAAAVASAGESPLGVRVAAGDSAMEVAAACAAAGARFVDVTGGTTSTDAEQRLAADLIRHTLGVPTVVFVDDVDDANTMLATGRADLVMLRSS